MLTEEQSIKVEEFARERVVTHGDLFGYSVVPSQADGSFEDQLLLVIAQDAEDDSFPKEIAGLQVVLEHVSAPEPQGV